MDVAMSISKHPPPHNTRVSLTVSVSTHRASCRDLSASSRRWEEAPRRMIEQACPLLQPENLINLSSPTMISSIREHSPRVDRSGRSNVLVISPPVTAANLSIPSKSACSILTTPASVNICSGKLYISCLLMKHEIPWPIIFSHLFLIFCFSASSISATLVILSTRTLDPYILILSVSMGVLAIMIFAFSTLLGWPTPKLLLSTNPSSRKESANDPPGFFIT
mmetsp:Transcript_7021/g.7135  ORF Transcript_7021/g.7135 Transcript_7021/m.7135 type:complete len:222 (-) Transcript_7021:141-806(-)